MFVNSQNDLVIPVVLQPYDSQLAIIDVAVAATNVEVRVEESDGSIASYFKVYSKLQDGSSCRSVVDGTRNFASLATGDEVNVVVSNTDFTQTRVFNIIVSADNSEEGR